ncbi:MAG TPA: 5-formyltetrahydrofolate cyclo-ligase [Candidatus Dojkabacteria bacterium]|jgi:5-formyltetrahydrofolate cyclo-ligase
MISSKEELREKYIKLRAGISQKSRKSQDLLGVFKKSSLQNKFSNWLLYKSAGSEISVDRIADFLKEMNKNLFLPFIEELAVGKFDEYLRAVDKGHAVFFEPANAIKNHNVEVALIPALVFDLQGNRLGYGKLAWYDRFLQNTNIYKIGICFDEQLIDNLNPEKHDIPMDAIITDKKILYINKISS